jgi:hypothetical protein
MPKTVQQKTSGFTLNVAGVPATIAEVVEQCGSEEAVIAAATDKVMIHSHLVAFRTAWWKYLEEATGFQRKREVEGEKVKYKETEGDYFARFEAYSNDELDKTYPDDYQDEAQAVMDSIEWTMEPKARGTGAGSRPAQTYFDRYQALVADKGEEKIAQFDEAQGINTDLGEDDLAVARANAIKRIFLEKKRAAEREAEKALESL